MKRQGREEKNLIFPLPRCCSFPSSIPSSGALQQSTRMEREWVYYGSEWDKIKIYCMNESVKSNW